MSRAITGMVFGVLYGVVGIGGVGLLLMPTPPRNTAEASQEARSATVAYNPGNDREQRALDLLQALGNDQPTVDTLAFVVEWSLAEDSGSGALDRNNPWNTTQSGFNETHSINSDGVRGYATWQDGLAATVHTLTNGYYDEVVAGLQTNDPERAKAGLITSPWAASHYNGGVGWPMYQPEQQQQRATTTGKHPVIEPRIVTAPFTETNCAYWGFQVNCMHWGTDFSGNQGDPVYAPYDLTIIALGEYGPGPTMGQYVQATLPDGHVIYFGHLQDRTPMDVGQVIPAGSVIGRMNVYAHTHVQFAPPGNTGACAQDGSCLDFEIYYEDH